MIVIPPSLEAVLARPDSSSFFLVRVGSLRKTNYPIDITVDGNLYESDGSLAAVDYPKMTSVVDKQTFQITLVDLDMRYVEMAEKTLTGAPVEVYLCYVNLDTGLPMIGPAERIVVYRGTVDSAQHSVETADGEKSTLAINCGSPMAALDRTATFYASNDFAEKNFPGDTAYENLFVGSVSVSLRWGK